MIFTKRFLIVSLFFTSIPLVLPNGAIRKHCFAMKNLSIVIHNESFLDLNMW